VSKRQRHRDRQRHRERPIKRQKERERGKGREKGREREERRHRQSEAEATEAPSGMGPAASCCLPLPSPSCGWGWGRAPAAAATQPHRQPLVAPPAALDPSTATESRKCLPLDGASRCPHCVTSSLPSGSLFPHWWRGDCHSLPLHPLRARPGVPSLTSKTEESR
jgi:hypothetical protein